MYSLFNLVHVVETLKIMILENKFLCCTSLASSLFLFYFLWIKKNRKREKLPSLPSEVQPMINEVLFFSEKYALCYEHDSYSSKCNSEDCGLKKLKKIISYLDSATQSLDVCVYTFSSEQLGNIILKKFNEGVRIRIITDSSMAFERGSQIPTFRKNGILIRARQSTQFLMHHKFAIVDNRLLLNGSFNWTRQATFGNWENVLITNYPESIIQQYRNEFEELWNTLQK